MLRFKSFILEKKLEGDLGNHGSGTLHEILVAHALNGGKHASAEAEKVHNTYAENLGGKSSDLYKHHFARAQKAAETIRNHPLLKGESITGASWTPRAAEKEGGHADPSDIYVHTKSGKKVGVSLKVGDSHGKKPISNPGASDEAKTYLQNAREQLAKEHPHTKGMSEEGIRAEASRNPAVAKTADRLRKETLEKATASLHQQYSQMNDQDLHHHVMKLIHAGPEYGENHIRVNTTGVRGNYRSSAIVPRTHYDNDIQPGKIAPVISGTSVLFKNKDTGKTVAKHRLKFMTGGLSSVKGSGESQL